MGRDNSVGIATRYGLEAPGIKLRLGARFSSPVQSGPGAYPASCTIGTGSFQGLKRQKRSAKHSPPPSDEVKERVELYLYSPLGAFMAGYSVSFIIIIIIIIIYVRALLLLLVM